MQIEKTKSNRASGLKNLLIETFQEEGLDNNLQSLMLE